MASPPYNASVLVAEKESADFYESVLAAVGKAASGQAKSKLAVDVANLVMGDYFGALNASGKSIADFPVTPAMLAELLDAPVRQHHLRPPRQGRLRGDGGDRQGAGGAWSRSAASSRSPTPAPSRPSIDAVMTAHADKVAEYRSGKDKLFGFFVGQVMKATQGKANPAVVNELLKKKLAG